MRSFFAVIFAATLLTLATAALAAEPTAPRWFVGAGATGTPQYGYQGGWNFGTGAELPLSRAAHFVVRADYQSLPFGENPFVYFGAMPAGGSSALDLGQSGSSVPHATLLALAMGLRLSADSRPVQTYADVLVGVGRIDLPPDAPVVMPMRDATPSSVGRVETNVMLSFGGGVRFLSAFGYGVFADAHYDFYYVEGANTPVVPIRFGLCLP